MYPLKHFLNDIYLNGLYSLFNMYNVRCVRSESIHVYNTYVYVLDCPRSSFRFMRK